MDFSLSHAGKDDISKHLCTQKHKKMFLDIVKIAKLILFFDGKVNNVIRTECLFTAFIVEHNLPDHIGPLLKKMFPGNEISNKYGCARTKTTAI